MVQDIIYNCLLILCLAVSCYNERARQNYFWIYFLLVLCYELFFSYKWIGIKIYTTSAILYSLFFVNVYLKELLDRRKYLVKWSLNIIVLGIGIYLYPENGYSISLGIMMAFIFIILGLVWLFNEFKINSQVSLMEKQFFWVSVSLLLWAVFFFLDWFQ
ncbi:hypothetical protein [Chryseobacterium sp. CH1]|uniref:hypothetical protein n=1 Tax=Chryseobacterium sp. CH1 TaxID=713551 RepID=UPI00100B12F5|nr:hypothetical protein [Chryseobacterium sp. CH1]RXM63823.1 hypothetical protein BOQ60_12870 [Chryseobacterium sp. CH1]